MKRGTHLVSCFTFPVNFMYLTDLFVDVVEPTQQGQPGTKQGRQELQDRRHQDHQTQPADEAGPWLIQDERHAGGREIIAWIKQYGAYREPDDKHAHHRDAGCNSRVGQALSTSPHAFRWSWQ